MNDMRHHLLASPLPSPACSKPLATHPPLKPAPVTRAGHPVAPWRLRLARGAFAALSGLRIDTENGAAERPLEPAQEQSANGTYCTEQLWALELAVWLEHHGGRGARPATQEQRAL